MKSACGTQIMHEHRHAVTLHAGNSIISALLSFPAEVPTLALLKLLWEMGGMCTGELKNQGQEREHKTLQGAGRWEKKVLSCPYTLCSPFSRGSARAGAKSLVGPC